MREEIQRNFTDARDAIDAFLNEGDNVDRIMKAGQMMVDAIKGGGKIISCGNGGSMCDAMHFAEELTGRFRNDRPSIPALSISDPSHMSCVGNDYGFEFVFSRYVEGVGREGDVLLGISTSGNSTNVIRAAEVAKKKNMSVVILSGKDGGQLKDLCDLEIRAPMSKYADRAQEIHIKVIHSLIQYIEANI